MTHDEQHYRCPRCNQPIEPARIQVLGNAVWGRCPCQDAYGEPPESPAYQPDDLEIYVVGRVR